MGAPKGCLPRGYDTKKTIPFKRVEFSAMEFEQHEMHQTGEATSLTPKRLPYMGIQPWFLT